MKKLIAVFFLLSTFTTSTYGKVFFSYCSNFGDGVSSAYASCVNNNLRQAGQALDAITAPCLHFSFMPISAYSACVNGNFISLQYKTEGKVYLSHCMNFGDTLSGAYTSCVHNNMRQLERYINGLEDQEVVQ